MMKTSVGLYMFIIVLVTWIHFQVHLTPPPPPSKERLKERKKNRKVMCYLPILILIQLIFFSLSTTFMCSDLNETILYLLFFLLVFLFWTCVLEHLH